MKNWRYKRSRFIKRFLLKELETSSQKKIFAKTLIHSNTWIKNAKSFVRVEGKEKET